MNDDIIETETKQMEKEIECQMDDAIKMIMQSVGIQLTDPNVIQMIKNNLKTKIDSIAADAQFYSSNQGQEKEKLFSLSI
jgi:hypothetical protein